MVVIIIPNLQVHNLNYDQVQTAAPPIVATETKSLSLFSDFKCIINHFTIKPKMLQYKTVQHYDRKDATCCLRPPVKGSGNIGGSFDQKSKWCQGLIGAGWI